MFFWQKLFSKKLKQKDDFAIQLTKILNFNPKNIEFYREALTHKSFNKISENYTNFERLEFLGDSVLGTVISEYLFHIAPTKREGYLSQMRSKIVSRKKLNSISKDLKLVNQIRKDRKSNLGEDIHGDIYEALIGAIYLDYGLNRCKEFIHRTILKNETIENLEKQIASYKSLLLEYSQKYKFTLKFQTEIEENAQEYTIFVSKVSYNQKVISKGRATSKKKAEEIAAKRAYYASKKILKIS